MTPLGHILSWGCSQLYRWDRTRGRKCQSGCRLNRVSTGRTRCNPARSQRPKSYGSRLEMVNYPKGGYPHGAPHSDILLIT